MLILSIMDGIFTEQDLAAAKRVTTLHQFLKLPMRTAVYVAYQDFKASAQYGKFEERLRQWWRYNITGQSVGLPLTNPKVDTLDAVTEIFGTDLLGTTPSQPNNRSEQ